MVPRALAQSQESALSISRYGPTKINQNQWKKLDLILQQSSSGFLVLLLSRAAIAM